MKTHRTISIATILCLLAALALSGEALAAGKQSGKRCGAQSSATKPVGSQRRDGTFAITGTTANGSTTRPGNGRGLQDGSRLNQ